jgi:hypothetical protein
VPRSGPQRAIVLESDLPTLSLLGLGRYGYRVRYRVVSEDANRFSHYSPIYDVPVSYIFIRPEARGPEEVAIIRQGPYINAVWPPVTANESTTLAFVKNINQYDLWIKWDRGEGNGIFNPAERVDGNQQGFVVPKSYTLLSSDPETGAPIRTVVNQEPTRVSIEIFVRANPQSRSSNLLRVYKIDDVNIAPPTPPPST